MSLKDIDAFLQQFVQKCIQVIVQSRLGTERAYTKCNPDGKDWFNLDIQDLKDIVDQTAKCLKTISAGQNLNQSLYFLKNNWNVCCEISLRNSDGISLILEYWMFSAKTLPNSQIPDTQKLAPFVYQTLTRMSFMLKSLITLSRATPAHRIASKGQSADSYVICYRVYQCDEDFLSEISLSGNGESSQFSSAKSLGSIKTICNEVTVSLIYRTSLMNLSSSDSGSGFFVHPSKKNENGLLPVKDDHFKKAEKCDGKTLLEPLNTAFADPKIVKTQDEYEIITDTPTPFSLLISPKEDSNDIFCVPPKNNFTKFEATAPINVSKPITIPTKCGSPKAAKSPQIYSTSNDSFVFVEINTPFANEEHEIGSFFNGPSPTFVNSEEDFNDIQELTNQLAEFDSNISQIDSFVESVCINETDELDPE